MGALLACTDEQAKIVADKVLTKSLRMLLDQRESVENRWDVWCWVHREDQPGEISFSFERCTRSVGVDSNELREKLCGVLLQRDAVPEEPEILIELGNSQRPRQQQQAWSGVAP